MRCGRGMFRNFDKLKRTKTIQRDYYRRPPNWKLTLATIPTRPQALAPLTTAAAAESLFSSSFSSPRWCRSHMLFVFECVYIHTLIYVHLIWGFVWFVDCFTLFSWPFSWLIVCIYIHCAQLCVYNRILIIFFVLSSNLKITCIYYFIVLCKLLDNGTCNQWASKLEHVFLFVKT